MLDHLAERVASLQPGEALRVDSRTLSTIRPVSMKGMFGPKWSAVDQIYEQTLGSSYTLAHYNDEVNRCVTFMRLLQPPEPGMFTYLAPDRRAGFRKFGRFWMRDERRSDSDRK